MRLSRQQVERLHEAMKDTAADEVELEVRSDGKLWVHAVEVVEKLRPLSLTRAGQNGREREHAVV